MPTSDPDTISYVVTEQVLGQRTLVGTDSLRWGVAQMTTSATGAITVRPSLILVNEETRARDIASFLSALSTEGARRKSRNQIFKWVAEDHRLLSEFVNALLIEIGDLVTDAELKGLSTTGIEFARGNFVTEWNRITNDG